MCYFCKHYADNLDRGNIGNNLQAISDGKKSEITLKWGLSKPICDQYFDHVKMYLGTFHGSNVGDQLDEYAKIFTVLADVDLVDAKIQQLSDGFSAPSHGITTPEVKWLSLSNALTYFEKKCWFPEDLLLPLGILTSDDFLRIVSCGYMLKDYGAGVKHGEFSHRLQWHIIMAVITEDFTKAQGQGWNKTPLQLYISLGDTFKKLWYPLFDQKGPGDFHHPDSLHRHLLTTSSSIQTFISKRETKRRTDFIDHICNYIDTTYGLNKTGVLGLLKGDNPYNSHEEFLQFEIWFVNQLRLKHPGDDSKVEGIYYSLANASEPNYLKNKTADPGTLTKKPKRRKVPYINLFGKVYATSNVVLDPKLAQSRAASSIKLKE